MKMKDTNASFFKYAGKHFYYLEKTGKIPRMKAEKSRVNQFKSFLNGEDISFQQITVALLRKYQSYLKIEHQLKDRSIVNNLIVIRTLFNQATGDGIVDQLLILSEKEIYNWDFLKV